MWDFISSVIANYGIQALTFALTAGLAWFASVTWSKLQPGAIKDLIGRAQTEVYAAVMEVAQTYVDGIKEGRADGKLTPDESKEALRRAILTAKDNIGPKGLARLARILGLDVTKWLTTRVETIVAQQKQPAAVIGAPSANPPAAPRQLPPFLIGQK